jgi:LysM repeat protein
MSKFITLSLILILAITTLPAAAQSTVGNGAAFPSGCTGLTESAIGSSVARVTAGGSTIYAGYVQVSGINQNPIVARFTGGTLNWCNDSYETGTPDARATGLYWDGSTLYVTFSIDGGTASNTFNASGGWLNSYGTGGGAKAGVVASINPSSGASLGATYVIARLSNGRTNTVNLNGISVSGGSVTITATSAYSPLNADRTTMSCSGPSGFPYTLVLSADLTSASSASATGCTMSGGSSGPGGGGTGGSGSGSGGSSSGNSVPLIADDRVNNGDLAAPVAIYCSSSGIQVYRIDSSARGTLVFAATFSQVNSSITTAQASGQNISVASGGNATLYVLGSNEFQVNAFDGTGKLYEFIFPLSRCSFSTSSSTSASNPNATPPPVASGSTYTVLAGDTLFKIGQRLGLPWLDIAAVNGLSAPYTIFEGQTLLLPG